MNNNECVFTIKLTTGEFMKNILLTLLALGTLSAFAQVNDCTVKVPKTTESKIINALVIAGFRPEVDNSENESVSCDEKETQFCLSITYDKGPLKPRVGYDILDTALFVATLSFSAEAIHEPYVSWKRDIKLGVNLHEAGDRKLGPIRASAVSNKNLRINLCFNQIIQ